MIFLNNTYYKEFPGNPLYNRNSQIPNNNYYSLIPEQSYEDNILKLNKGKKVTIYQTYKNSEDWKSKKFTGIIENSGKDYIILSDPNTGMWYLLLMKYVDYIEFDEQINTNEQFYSNR